MRAVRFTEYGGIDVLQVAEVPAPEPGAGEVAVDVRATGINPGEAAIREGVFDPPDAPKLPSGQGSDLAGVVAAVGDGVEGLGVGDEVLGWSWQRSAQADRVVVGADQLIPKPAELSWEVAGALYVVGVTAFAAARAIGPVDGETVVAVSSAAGGVGTVAVQLLRHRGARVLGIASESNHEWLRAHGVEPVTYGDGLADRLRTLAGARGIDAFVDLHGPEYLDLAVELGVPRDRIETIIAFRRAGELGTKAEGSVDATTPEILAEMTALVASGAIEVPIAATYPVEQVREAYTELARGHTRGKIVLTY